MTSLKNKKNSLTIRLAESAVFLRTDLSHTLHNNGPASNAFCRNGMLRGLLVLDLVKPTKITSIDVELTGLTTTSCPEGIGARQVEITEQHAVFHASTTFFCASNHLQKCRSPSASSWPRRSASIGPGVFYQNRDPTPDDGEESEEDSSEETESRRSNSIASRSATARHQTPSHTRTRSSTPRLIAVYRERSTGGLSAPIPPYSPLPPPESLHLYPFPVSPTANSSSSLLRRPSFTDTIFEDVESSSVGVQTEMGLRGPLPMGSRTRSQPANTSTASEQQLSDQHRSSRTPSRTKRFSFSTMSNVLLDAVNSGSHRKTLSPPARGIETGSRRESSVGRSFRTEERGRPREREERNNLGSPSLEIRVAEEDILPDIREEREKTSIISKILGDREDGSKQFKEGTYTYPISFTIPSSAPPTLQAEFGSVSWRLKASVHRPGTFHSRLSAEREVVVINCPTEEETEESENIIIERNWDQWLQYLISVSGKAFFIGGTVPISFVLMPLDKVKVHRIAVYIEEKVEYFSRFQRPLRSDPPLKFCLLSLRHEGKNSSPILPLESSSSNVLRSSPFFKVIDRETRHNPDEMGELAASLMGPGPWRFHRDLQLPSDCNLMKFTNKNLKANVRVGHLLKVVMRLEKPPAPDDLHTAQSKKPSLFDVVVQTPVVILSCRCNPDWVSLPRYTEVFDDTLQDVTLTCPCRNRQKSNPPSSRSSMDSLALLEVPSSSPPSSSSSGLHLHNGLHPQSSYGESMLQSSSLFERLVSGQESETGEAPPAYDHLRSRVGTQSLSSVAVREVQAGIYRRSQSAALRVK